jgi:hypothetical protein
MLTKPQGLDDRLRSPHDEFRSPCPRKARRSRRPFIVLLSSAGLLATLFVASPRQFVHQIEISIIRQPTPYTQLFFSDPEAIPSRLRLDRPERFTFTIVNDEGRSSLYHFAVMMNTVGLSTTVVANGSLRLNDEGIGTRTVTFVPSKPRHRYLITVVLDRSGLSIDFYGETP